MTSFLLCCLALATLAVAALCGLDPLTLFGLLAGLAAGVAGLAAGLVAVAAAGGALLLVLAVLVAVAALFALPFLLVTASGWLLWRCCR